MPHKSKDRHSLKKMLALTLVLLALSCPALMAQSVSQSSLIFPLFVSDQSLTSALAIFNPSGSEATVTLALNNAAGNLLTNATVTVPPYGQLAETAGELFPGLDSIDGSVLLTSPTSGLIAYSMTYNGQLSVIDGGPAAGVSNELLFPVVPSTSEGIGEISITNPNARPTAVALSLWSTVGALLGSATIQIPPGGLYSAMPQNIFPSGTDFSWASHITAVSQPINLFSQAQTIAGVSSFSGFSSVLVPGGNLDSAQLNAQPLSQLTNTGVIPYFRTGPLYASTFCLDNVESSAVNVTLTAINNSGVTLGTQTVSVPAMGGFSELMPSLFPALGPADRQGWILIQSSGRVHAAILFGTSNGGALSAVPVQPLPMTDVVFPQVVQGSGNFTEITAVNPGRDTVYVDIHVVDPSGKALASNQIALPPGSRVSQYLSQLMPEISSQSGGYVFLQATEPIFSTASIWINNSTSVANLVPQALTVSYQPPALSSFAATGVITLNGEPARDLNVALSGPVGALATSGADGTYAFTGLPAGHYSMGVDTTGSGFMCTQVNFEITTASIRQNFQCYTAPNSIVVEPSSMPVASPDTAVDVFGTNFATSSTVVANSVSLATTYVDSTHLTAVIPSYLMASPADIEVSVVTGSTTTQSFPFVAFQDQPVLTSVQNAAKANIVEGNPGTTLTLQGSGFLPGLTVTINGNSDGISVNLIDSNNALAYVPATYFQQGGIFPVVVSNPIPSNSESNIQLLTVYYPSPEVDTVSPSSLSAELEVGSGPADIEIGGFGFRRGAVALFNGTPLSTWYCEESDYCLATSLYASIPAGLLQQSGYGEIMVQNPSPTLASSGTFLVQVSGLVPTITAATPGSAAISETPVTFNMPVVVNGTNFGPQTQYAFYRPTDTPTWSTTNLQILSSSELVVTIPVTYPASLGTWNVMVMNPPPGGGVSNIEQFALTQENFASSPFLIDMNPSSVAAGGPGFTLTITGVNFLPGAQVQFYTTLLPATFVSSTQVTVQVPAYLLQAGLFPIVLINPDMGGASNRLYLTVQ